MEQESSSGPSSGAPEVVAAFRERFVRREDRDACFSSMPRLETAEPAVGWEPTMCIWVRRGTCLSPGRQMIPAGILNKGEKASPSLPPPWPCHMQKTTVPPALRKGENPAHC